MSRDSRETEVIRKPSLGLQHARSIKYSIINGDTQKLPVLDE